MLELEKMAKLYPQTYCIMCNDTTQTE